MWYTRRLRHHTVIASLAVLLVTGNSSSALGGSSWAGTPTPMPSPASAATSDIVCPDARSQVKNLYFGDLHIHTSYSMDAYIRETRGTPWDAYAFARGGLIGLGPVDVNGEPTRTKRLPPGRELDFASVTDHSEYLGEVLICTDPDLDPQAYNSSSCISYRDEGKFGQFKQLSPDRLPAVCGIDGQNCDDAASLVWQDTINAAGVSNVPCEFTAFVGYEWTAALYGANLHRNVIFRNDQVPALPFSAFASSDPQDLWDMLDLSCPPGSGCEAITIPHNTNLSSGVSLQIQYSGAATLEEQRVLAAQRERLERLLEITQHKGTSECLPGFSNDEFCGFELFQPNPPVCDAGVNVPDRNVNCVAEIDTLRGALKEGLAEYVRIGVNPLKLGVMASTDTHNGTAGDVMEVGFKGHNGANDATPYQRLTRNPRNSPGGLIAVWATQNTRDAIFDAMKRRETYGTSGPRMTVRFFGGSSFQPADCQSQSIAVTGYRKGMPMGGEMIDQVEPRMAFLIQVLADQAPIDHIQIIKGFIDDNGTLQETILEDPTLRHPLAQQAPPSCDDPDVDCPPLCGVIEDTAFQTHQPAFYYLRILEHATPRWSKADCAFSSRTAALSVCQPGAVALPETIQERAWTSPIWYLPNI